MECKSDSFICQSCLELCVTLSCIIILYSFTVCKHNSCHLEELDCLLHNNVPAGIGVVHVIIFALMLCFLAGINATTLHSFHMVFALSGPIGTD